MAGNPAAGTPPRIDLYSDTVTRPTPAMRKAIAEAEVGNEQAHEDPTVNRLCDMVRDLLGKPAAVFMPSGTMCNQIAYRIWCRPGDEVLLDRSSHALHFEYGGMAANAGAMTRTIDGTRGTFTAAQAGPLIRGGDRKHTQRTAVISVENTANMGGGTVWPLAQLQDLSALARKRGVAMHMDGARLLNAVVASGTPAGDYAATCESVWVDLSKGLGCPVGAVLAGPEDFIEQAWGYKHMYGGAMRQAGIIAAAGVYALEHHVDRLAEDHENARRLAAGLAEVKGIAVNPNEIDTNMVFFDVAGLGVTARDFANRLRADHGIRIGPQGDSLLRAVTHLDVSRAQIDETIQAVKAMARG
jgi:threonine aldolase